MTNGNDAVRGATAADSDATPHPRNRAVRGAFRHLRTALTAVERMEVALAGRREYVGTTMPVDASDLCDALDVSPEEVNLKFLQEKEAEAAKLAGIARAASPAPQVLPVTPPAPKAVSFKDIAREASASAALDDAGAAILADMKSYHPDKYQHTREFLKVGSTPRGLGWVAAITRQWTMDGVALDSGFELDHRMIERDDPSYLKKADGRDCYYHSLNPLDNIRVRIFRCVEGMRFRFWAKVVGGLNIPSMSVYFEIRNGQAVEIDRATYDSPKGQGA